MATTEDEEEGKGKEEEPKKGGSKKLIIIAAAVVLVVAGVAGVFLMGGSKAPEGGAEAPEAAEAHEERHYMTAKLDPFIVNLSEVNSFAKVTILIEYDPSVLEKVSGGSGGGHGGGGAGGEAKAEGGGLPSLIQEREPMMRDAIIRVISSKKPAEVLSPDGKERLKEELLEAINEALQLEEAPVVNIYFTEFIIQ